MRDVRTYLSTVSSLSREASLKMCRTVRERERERERKSRERVLITRITPSRDNYGVLTQYTFLAILEIVFFFVFIVIELFSKY